MVIPAEIRAALEEHARAEEPNEACGLVALTGRRGRALHPGRNAAASPYRFELETEPENWFLEDEGYELAVFHSHISSPPRPSRTDVENIGLWEGRPYLILSLGTGDLAAWRIAGGEVSADRARGLGGLEACPSCRAGHGRARCRCRCTSCPS